MRAIGTALLAGAMITGMSMAATAQGGPKGSGSGSMMGRDSKMGPDAMMGPGVMMGPGMMGGGGFGHSCHPRAAGMAEWRMNQLETALKPTDAQKAKLADLRAASTKAAETISAACATELPAKAVDRFGVMEKRLEAMQVALKTVRPAFEAFYASLDDAQKAKLDTVGPRQWGWGRWRWRWN